jgi:hypothetical protein
MVCLLPAVIEKLQSNYFQEIQAEIAQVDIDEFWR